MKKSKILQKDQEDLIALHKSMTPREKLVAHLNHSQLITQLYQAGVNFRSRSSKKSRTHEI